MTQTSSPDVAPLMIICKLPAALPHDDPLPVPLEATYHTVALASGENADKKSKLLTTKPNLLFIIVHSIIGMRELK